MRVNPVASGSLKGKWRKPTTKQAMNDAAINQIHHGMRLEDILSQLDRETPIIDTTSPESAKRQARLTIAPHSKANRKLRTTASRKLNLTASIDCISVGVDRMQRNFEPLRKQGGGVAEE
jgi:hypothetical protein